MSISPALRIEGILWNLQDDNTYVPFESSKVY